MTLGVGTDAYSWGVGKFLLVVVAFAALVYGVFWLIERRRVGAPPPRSRPTPPPNRSVAPDDDAKFLRDLDRKRRRTNEPEGNEPDGPPEAR